MFKSEQVTWRYFISFFWSLTHISVISGRRLKHCWTIKLSTYSNNKLLMNDIFHVWFEITYTIQMKMMMCCFGFNNIYHVVWHVPQWHKIQGLINNTLKKYYETKTPLLRRPQHCFILFFLFNVLSTLSRNSVKNDTIFEPKLFSTIYLVTWISTEEDVLLLSSYFFLL